MKDLTKYFIDLIKCSEEQQKHIRTKIFNSKFPVATLTRHILENMMKHRIKETPYILINEFDHWKLNENHEGKTELTYPEFIKLFEGGEGEILPDVAYWRNRCLLAEKCLSVSPCDPDITNEQINAHKAYNQFLETFGNKD